MKTFLVTICALLGITFALSAQEKQSEQLSSKVLVAYFSATGTTKAAAQKIAQSTGGALRAIEPVKAYTSADLNWRNDQARCSVEMHDLKARPTCKPIEVESYEVVYLGYPIWWNQAPRVINSFLESHELKGKIIIPFATSGSSSIDNSVKQLKQNYPDLLWQEGKLLNGASQAEVDAWVKSQR